MKSGYKNTIISEDSSYKMIKIYQVLLQPHFYCPFCCTSDLLPVQVLSRCHAILILETVTEMGHVFKAAFAGILRHIAVFKNHLLKTVLKTNLENKLTAGESCQKPDFFVDCDMAHLEVVANHRQRDDLF